MDFKLTEHERMVLKAVWEETISHRSYVDAVSFRADHEEYISALDRLCRLRYLKREDTSYDLTPLGLAEVNDQESRDVMDVGRRVLDLFRSHYKDSARRLRRLYFKDVVTELGVDREYFNFIMSVLEDLLSFTTSTRTIDLYDDDAYVVVSESVFNYKSIEDYIEMYAGWRNQALAQEKDSSWQAANLFALKKTSPELFDDELMAVLPKGLRSLLHEIRVAHEAQMTSLATIGMRAVLEAFMVDKVGDAGSFERNIKAMADRGILNGAQVEFLRAALELGHAAMHRMHVPSINDCNQMIGIVEHLLRESYLLGENAKRLKESTPARRK